MTVTTTKSRRDTGQKILAAASELFLRDGYARTNLEQVAAAAGVTKPTIYSHFGSKEKLLDAVTRGLAQQPLQAIVSSLAPTNDPRADLLRFATTFTAIVFSEKAIAIRRFAAAEALDHPEVGHAFFENGPACAFGALTEYLNTQQTAARLSLPDAERAAEQLIGLLLGLDLLRSHIGEPLASAESIERRCQDAVDLFLASYGASG